MRLDLGLNLGVYNSSINWTPAELPNLALWLDAADASTITLNGSTVSQWNDKSGNGRNATQATAANQPTYTASGLNGKPVFTFDGINDYLTHNLFPTNLTAINLFIVAKWTTTGTTTATIQALIDNNHSGIPLLRGFAMQDRPDLVNHPVTFAHIPIATSGAIDTETTGNNTWRIINGLAISGGDDFLRINGNQRGFLANGGFFNLQTTFNIGAWFNGSIYSRFYGGQIAEIVLTDNNLNTEILEGYLAHKWELTANLPVSHPFKTLPPTL